MAERLLLRMCVLFFYTSHVILLCGILRKCDMIWGWGGIANYKTVQDFKDFKSYFESVIK